MPYGERIKYFRKMRGLSQGQIAIRLGITQGAVSQWETDRTQPDSNQLIALAALLGISVDKLLGRPEETPQTEDMELLELRERLRNDPNFRILFSAARNASPDHIRAAAAMLKALEPEDDQ